MSDSFIFLFLSMILIACSLYLPHHIAFLITRAWFYYQGDAVAASDPAVVEGAIESVLESGKEVLKGSATSAGERLRGVVETAVAAARASEGVVREGVREGVEEGVRAAGEGLKEL